MGANGLRAEVTVSPLVRGSQKEGFNPHSVLLEGGSLKPLVEKMGPLRWKRLPQPESLRDSMEPRAFYVHWTHTTVC